MKILFVCNQGKNRSRTAAEMFKDMYDTDSMGVYCKDEHRKKLEWADAIFVMENRQRNWIGENHAKVYLNKKIENLDIPDRYSYGDDSLKIALRRSVERILD